MKTKLSILPILVAAFLSIQPSLSAQDTTQRLIPFPKIPEKRGRKWKKCTGLCARLMTGGPLNHHRNRWRSSRCRFAARHRPTPTRPASSFVRFPTNENVGDARITVVYALSHAVAAGDTNAENQVSEFASAVLADKTIPEDDRVGVLMYAGNSAFMKKVGMRLFTEGMSKLHDEFETHSIETMRAALETVSNKFNDIHHAGGGGGALEGRAAKGTGQRDPRTAPGAPPGAKTLAPHILKGTKPYQVGKPLDIRFTALDGREVDLAKLKGNVVLVDFWSTTCGPCIAEMPAVKAAYEKLA